MNHLLRDHAPLTEASWSMIDREARARLTTNLAARKLVDFSGPHGWGRSATALGRVTTLATAPVEGVVAQLRQVLPLVELRTSFTLACRELADVDRGADDVDLGALDEAVRTIAISENAIVFHGFPDAGMVGIMEASAHPAVSLGADTGTYPRAVAKAVALLAQAGIGGPYGLAIEPDGYTAIIETVEKGGYLLLGHLRQILDGPVVRAPGIRGAVVLSLRGGDFILESGQDLSVGYAGRTMDTVHLYVEESLSFRVTEPDAAVVLRAL
ncbi:family 1 encapsulin nanocompartment shell protein [Frankia sp. Cas4]|uniref:family 1 encapsulin nanocompartment shell protein n=1 Tax=Frankia sp. Cas4 TaxID=3073927 RepID=UPI002AD2F302|nr:family 1 encapsulin nanocompartment shell protein [Frankia sp. Cas4]